MFIIFNYLTGTSQHVICWVRTRPLQRD